MQGNRNPTTPETTAETWLTDMQAETASLAALTHGLSIILATHTSASREMDAGIALAHVLEEKVGVVIGKLEAFEAIPN